MFPQIQPNKKRWLARKIIPLAQQGTVTDNPPFTHRVRTQSLASIVDAWSIVVALPLFVSVGLQQNITPPPPLDPAPQLTIHANWIPPGWDTQVTRKVVQSAATVPPGPYTFVPAFPISQWPQPDWPVQTAPHTPQPPAVVATIPTDRWSNIIDAWQNTVPVPLWGTVGTQAGADVQYPKVAYTNDGRVASMAWEPLTWDTQTTRKAPQVAAIPAPPGPTPHRPYVELDRWATTVAVPLWQTVATQSSTPAVNNPPPLNRTQSLLVGLWSQPDWPTQATEKAPIPNVPAVPFSRTAFQGIDRWESLTWDTQQTRKTPIPSQAAQVDNPPPRTISYPIYDRWYNAPITHLWQSLGYTDGPTVGPADNPPLRAAFPAAIYSAWEPPAPFPVWSWRLIDLSVLPWDGRKWLPTVLDAAWAPPPHYQPRRPVVTPSGVLVIDNPPFTSRRPQLPAYDANWPQPTWPAQRAPFIVQPGVDNPPVTDLMRRRHLDIILRLWETIPDVRQRRPIAIPQGVVFRRTLSVFGTGVGHRQPHGWT